MRITNYDKCTGCSLCAFSCPTGAIQLQYSQDSAFWYPEINATECIHCNQCVSVCPSNDAEASSSAHKQFFVAQETDSHSLRYSTSGGVASALAKQFIAQGGTVYGAAFGSDMYLEHIRCTTENDCKRIKGSKYVQSDILNAFSRIAQDLRQHIPVLFIGTPCQCAAMKKAFAQYEFFYCCDLICNGVGSPLVFKKHIRWLESIYHCKLKNYIFRPKSQKYLEPYEIFVDTTEKEYRIRAPWKKWGSIYYSALVLRSSCFECMYCKETRMGDITLSDIPLDLLQTDLFEAPYNILDLGGSLISVNSDSGRALLQKIDKTVYLKEISTYRMDRPKHKTHDMQRRVHFCVEAMISLEKAKRKHLGWKLKLKSLIIEMIEYLQGILNRNKRIL